MKSVEQKCGDSISSSPGICDPCSRVLARRNRWIDVRCNDNTVKGNQSSSKGDLTYSRSSSESLASPFRSRVRGTLCRGSSPILAVVSYRQSASSIGIAKKRLFSQKSVLDVSVAVSSPAGVGVIAGVVDRAAAATTGVTAGTTGVGDDFSSDFSIVGGVGRAGESAVVISRSNHADWSE